MKLLTTLLFFYCTNILGQNNSDIYRLEAKNESPGVGSYVVNVIVLESDGSYEITYQEYLTKKRKKKNLIFNLKKEIGIWKKEGNVLLLKQSKTNDTLKFLIKDKNNIALFMNDYEISPINWKKIKQ